MQTFLPYRDYRQSAQVLDSVRLNKQIVEAQQILMVLHGELDCYANHPAVRMWAGYEQSLCKYAMDMVNEWYAHRKTPGSHKSAKTIMRLYNGKGGPEPWWLGTREIHLTHQSRLMHKGMVDVLKTRFGKPREQKRNYNSFRGSHGYTSLPKEWYALLPDDVRLINKVLDYEGAPQATKKNHYGFPFVSTGYAYIWPTEYGRYKTKPNGKWEEWSPGQLLPFLIGR